MTADLVKDPFLVYALVELFKDIYPTASDSVKRLATAVAGIIVAALAVWVPGMSWRDYLIQTLYQGLAVGAAATLGHAGVKAISPKTTPSVEQTAEKIARVTKQAAKEEITAEQAAAANTPPPPAPAVAQPVTQLRVPEPPPVVAAPPVVPPITRVPRERDLT